MYGFILIIKLELDLINSRIFLSIYSILEEVGGENFLIDNGVLFSRKNGKLLSNITK